jgi:Ankyrin repeats (many copies)
MVILKQTLGGTMTFGEVLKNSGLTGLEFEKVRQYVLSGGDVDYQEPENGWSLLHYAAEHGNIEAIQFLSSSGATINLIDIYGCTPLHRAVDSAVDSDVYCAIQIDKPVTMAGTKALIDAGANEEVRDEKGDIPRDIAAHYGHMSLEKYDAVSRKDWSQDFTFQQIAERCYKTFLNAGYNVRMLEGWHIGVKAARNEQDLEEGGVHIYRLVSGEWNQRHSPNFEKQLIENVEKSLDFVAQMKSKHSKQGAS